MKNIRVGISFYNGSKYFEEQLLSIHNCFKNLPKGYEGEVYVYDDGSVNEEVSKLKKICSKFSFVKVFLNENKGIFLNFLGMFSMAQLDGVDYLFLGDQDDIWLENKFMDQINAHEDTEKAMVISSSLIWDPKSLNEPVHRGYVSNHGHNQSFDIKKLNKLDLRFLELDKYFERNKPSKLLEAPTHDTFLITLFYALGELARVDIVTAWHRTGESFTTDYGKYWDPKVYANPYGVFYEYRNVFINVFNLDLKYTVFNASEAENDERKKSAKFKSYLDNFAMFLRIKWMRNLAENISTRITNRKNSKYNRNKAR